jgi:HTH-type transcriptional regulator/antitoxin HipB
LEDFRHVLSHHCDAVSPPRQPAILCVNSYISCLSKMAHIFDLLAISDIDALSGADHNFRMTDLARNPKQIGNLIRRARKQRGWSQTRLGEKAGLRQETISLIETGNPATKLDTIFAVLAALDLEFQIGARSKGQAATIEDIF